MCAAQPQVSNKLTLVNRLDQIGASSFPSAYSRFAFAARFSWLADPPEEDVTVAYRLVRYSEGDSEDEVVTLGGTWKAGPPDARVYVNFAVLQLFRPERVWFRLEHRVGEGPWERGAETYLDVKALDVDPPEATAD